MEKEGGFIFGPIAMAAGGIPALINILNGVGTKEDYIAVSLAAVSVVVILCPEVRAIDAIITATALVNDVETRPGKPEEPAATTTPTTTTVVNPLIGPPVPAGN